VTLAAKRSYLGRVYLDWAQYPTTENEPLPEDQGYIVRFKDLRFQQPGHPGRSVLAASVELDRNLKVVGENFGPPPDKISARNAGRSDAP
jgi:hypothetical protein